MRHTFKPQSYVRHGRRDRRIGLAAVKLPAAAHRGSTSGIRAAEEVGAAKVPSLAAPAAAKDNCQKRQGVAATEREETAVSMLSRSADASGRRAFTRDASGEAGTRRTVHSAPLRETSRCDSRNRP